MTYGYSSQLQDTHNLSELKEWAMGLLHQVDAIRRTDSVSFSVQSVPLIVGSVPLIHE